MYKKIQKILGDSRDYNKDSLSSIIYNSNDKILDCRLYIREIFYLLESKIVFLFLKKN